MDKFKKSFTGQLTPIFFTIAVFILLSTLLYGILVLLSLFPLTWPTILDFRRREPLIGIIIYLKTAFDFAIFIESLMRSNPGWKKRIAIALGTATGNAFGIFIMLTIWTFAKEIKPLVIVFMFISSVILLKIAEENFEEFLKQKKSFVKIDITKPVSLLQGQLNLVNKIFRPLLKFFVKDFNLKKTTKLSFLNLVIFSLTIPFVLGLNSFSAYIPISMYINIFGFTLGVLIGHMLLTVGLFAIPNITIKFVKNPIILISGGVLFILLGLFGLFEVILLLTGKM